jgi:hypothetical protein
VVAAIGSSFDAGREIDPPAPAQELFAAPM